MTAADINTGFLFESSDANILSVGADGTVTGNALGTAKLTVKTYNGLSSACSVAVQNAPESVSFPQENTNVFAGEKLKLAPVLPSGSASANITYASDNDAVAKAQGNEIVAVADGTANITATTFNGKTATCQITVVEAPYYIRTNLDPNKPMVALSFDDGPNKATTSIVLDTLEQYNGSATFFIVGNRLQHQGNKECAERMVKLGASLVTTRMIIRITAMMLPPMILKTELTQLRKPRGTNRQPSGQRAVIYPTRLSKMPMRRFAFGVLIQTIGAIKRMQTKHMMPL